MPLRSAPVGASPDRESQPDAASPFADGTAGGLPTPRRAIAHDFGTGPAVSIQLVNAYRIMAAAGPGLIVAALSDRPEPTIA